MDATKIIPGSVKYNVGCQSGWSKSLFDFLRIPTLEVNVKCKCKVGHGQGHCSARNFYNRAPFLPFKDGTP